nr:MAG TPA: hypothetical protein [Caudoviricetes sp.]
MINLLQINNLTLKLKDFVKFIKSSIDLEKNKYYICVHS